MKWNKNKFFISITWNFTENIPQPRWLKRWYYKKSFQWWDHPSNHHWKCFSFGNGLDDCFVDRIPLNTLKNKLWNWWRKKCMLLPGERDVWSGSYCQDPIIDETYDISENYYKKINKGKTLGRK